MNKLTEIEKSLHEIIKDAHPELQKSLEFILKHLQSRRRHREATNVPQLYFKLKASQEPNLPPLWQFKEVFALLAEAGVGKIDETTRDMRFVFSYEVKSVGDCGLGKGPLKEVPKQLPPEAGEQQPEGHSPTSSAASVQKVIQVEVPLRDSRKAKLSLPIDLSRSEWSKIFKIASKARNSRI